MVRLEIVAYELRGVLEKEAEQGDSLDPFKGDHKERGG